MEGTPLEKTYTAIAMFLPDTTLRPTLRNKYRRTLSMIK